MLRLALVTLFVPSLALADASYDEPGTVTHDCAKDGVVTVNAAAGTFTFSGTCTTITVTGAANTVTVEASTKVEITGSKNIVTIGAADRIGVTGSLNTVSYKKGLKAAKPKVASTGAGNKVKKVK